MHYSRGYLSGNHRGRGSSCLSDVAEPRKCALREGVWICNESSRCLIPKDGEVGGECGGGFGPRSGSKDGFQRNTWLLYKHANKGFAVFKAAEITGVPDEVVCCLLEALEACFVAVPTGVCL